MKGKRLFILVIFTIVVISLGCIEQKNDIVPNSTVLNNDTQKEKS